MCLVFTFCLHVCSACLKSVVFWYQVVQHTMTDLYNRYIDRVNPTLVQFRLFGSLTGVKATKATTKKDETK